MCIMCITHVTCVLLTIYDIYINIIIHKCVPAPRSSRACAWLEY